MTLRSLLGFCVALAWWFYLYNPVAWPSGTIAPPGPWEERGTFDFYETCERYRKDFIAHVNRTPTQGVTKCLYEPLSGAKRPTKNDLDIKPKMKPQPPRL